MNLAIKLLDVERLPPPFSYPYGDDQSWELTRLKSLLQANKGEMFEPIYQHQSDVSHLTAVSQSVVQDVMWLHEVVEQVGASDFVSDLVTNLKKISQSRLRVYFFRLDPGDPSTADNLYALVPNPKQLRKVNLDAWRRLINQESFEMFLYSSPQTDEPSGSWNCKVVPHPKRLRSFENHCPNDLDLVLRVRTPQDEKAVPRHDDMDIKIFADRRSANDALAQEEEH
ncbi:hypothetical protein NW762_009161 [Fusarium torreyae]|uniref:Uncharacterized protein n=1 Tax=Fusarium torreyae TaxID=1237075 RepID=A0A9W8VEJ9_9HYPO|nr:hypothetical protein NW762_009161 [Fusarium torreyae]